MKRITITDLVSNEELESVWEDRRLLFEHLKGLNATTISQECEVYDRDGRFVAALAKDRKLRRVAEQAYPVLSRLTGELSNRPSVIGKNVRTQELRKDGTLTNYFSVPAKIRALHGGHAERFGWIATDAKGRWMAKRTRYSRNLAKYEACLRMAVGVDRVFSENFPRLYREQRLRSAPLSEFLLAGTVFTTAYFIDTATAVHEDESDRGLAVMTTIGDYRAGGLLIPQIRTVFEYQPGTIVGADVSRLHGNLPLISGDRICGVFYSSSDLLRCLDQE